MSLSHHWRPTNPMFDHRVKNCQQLAHASSQSNLRRFACCAQSSIELPDRGIASASNQRSHIECRPHTSPTTPNRATPPKCPAVPIERCHADQCSNLFAVESSQLRQFGEQGAANNRTDARDAFEQVLLLVPDRALTNALVKFAVDSLQLGFQPTDVSFDTFAQRSSSPTESVSFRHNHLGELASARNQCPQFLGGPVGQGTQSRAQGDVEPRFRNVDANKDGGNFHDQILLFSRCLQYSSALQMMRAWLAQATVRAFAEAGRDDPCSRTASHDQGNNGLSRPVWF